MYAFFFEPFVISKGNKIKSWRIFKICNSLVIIDVFSKAFAMYKKINHCIKIAISGNTCFLI
jgi:hypothetical protein